MLIEARNLHYTIDDRLVLNGIDFTLREGECVGLIGPNGAGKSTLLKLLGGLWQGASGDLQVMGKPLRQYTARERARIIGYVPQSTYLDFPFTVREVVLMGRSPHLGRFQMETARDRAIAERALHAAHAAYLSDRLVTTLSGGERQRVLIARALAQEPRIMLLDEPTNNLDVKHQMDVMALARSLAQGQGLGVVAAVHDLAQAARYCDRLALIVGGEVIADGTPETVLTPERLRYAFGIDAQLYRDPYNGSLALSLK